MKHPINCLLSIGLFIASAAFGQPAETILKNGKIISADDKSHVYQAMAIRDGKIIALGKKGDLKAWQGDKTNIIDLQGKSVIPGLIDSHMHAIRAALSYSKEVHWFGLTSIEAALTKLKQAAAQAKPGEWLIVAGGWTEEQFKEGRRPTQEELIQAAPNNPVYVQWMY